MCVDHLNRCKTSIRCFGALLFDLNFHGFLFSISRRGGHSISLGLCPTKLPVKWDIRLGQPDLPAIISNFVNGNRLSQVPACRFQFFSILITVRFWQSELLLTSSDGTVASSKDVERILLHCFSRRVIHSLLSGLNEVFLHVRCIPHQ